MDEECALTDTGPVGFAGKRDGQAQVPGEGRHGGVSTQEETGQHYPGELHRRVLRHGHPLSVQTESSQKRSLFEAEQNIKRDVRTATMYTVVSPIVIRERRKPSDRSNSGPLCELCPPVVSRRSCTRAFIQASARSREQACTENPSATRRPRKENGPVNPQRRAREGSRRSVLRGCHPACSKPWFAEEKDKKRAEELKKRDEKGLAWWAMVVDTGADCVRVSQSNAKSESKQPKSKTSATQK